MLIYPLWSIMGLYRGIGVMPKRGKLFFLMVLVLCFLAADVISAPTPASIIVGNPERGNESVSEVATLYSGNVTQVNITARAITGRWGGFYGAIEGGINLSDASSHTFYHWTVTNITNAIVYAANSTLSSWVFVPINESLLPSWLTSEGMDNFDRTFTQTEVFSSASIASVPDTPFTATWQAGSQGSLKTYALMENNTNTNVWAGKAIWNTTSFKGTTRVDYQIIAPGDSDGVVYNFYLELP